MNIVGTVDILELGEIPKTISTLLWVTKYVPGNRAASGRFGLGNAIITDANGQLQFNFESCKITYPDLVDENGNALVLESLTSGTLSPAVCSDDEYRGYYEGMSRSFLTLLTYLAYQSVIGFIETAHTLNSQQIFVLTDLVYKDSDLK